MLDITLKSGEARSGFQDVEREYGMIELHSESVDGLLEAGHAILSGTAIHPYYYCCNGRCGKQCFI